MIAKEGADLRGRVADTVRTLGEYLAEHADAYAEAVTSAPCVGYTVSFSDVMDGEALPTVRFEVEHTDRRFFEV